MAKSVDNKTTDKGSSDKSSSLNGSVSEAKNLVNVQVDGVWHKFPAGMRIIEALASLDIEVPHYCYHPKLTSPGNCRMCLIEMGMPPRIREGEETERDQEGFLKIGWIPKPAISCSNFVAENMGIRTDSKLVRECRESVMEFLLINHPLDCPICDQAGECHLQQFSVEYGRGQSRFRENKNKKPKHVDIGTNVILDKERCILCTRCVRFCDEVVDDPVLGIVERGSFGEIEVFPGEKLNNNYSLNTVDICPVGALTSKDFRFQMRPWFLKSVESICTGCATGCNINIDSREDKIYRFTPRRNDEVNSTWMCDYGRLSFHNLHRKDRVNFPFKKIKTADVAKNANRSKGDFLELDWDKALLEFKKALDGANSSEVCFLISGSCSNEEYFLLRKICDFYKINLEQVSVIREIGSADNYLLNRERSSNINGSAIFFKGCEVDTDDLRNLGMLVKEIRTKNIIIYDPKGDLAKSLAGHFYKGVNRFLMGAYFEGDHLRDFDLLLPLAGATEAQGSMINCTGRLQRLMSAVAPAGECKSGWLALGKFCQMCQIAGFSKIESSFSFFEIFNVMVKENQVFQNLSWADIGADGVEIMKKSNKIKLLEKERERVQNKLING